MIPEDMLQAWAAGRALYRCRNDPLLRPLVAMAPEERTAHQRYQDCYEEELASVRTRWIIEHGE